MAGRGTVDAAGSVSNQQQVGTGLTEKSKDRKVIWLWSRKWKSLDDMHFDEVEIASFQIDRVLVAANMTGSRTEAQRLIKAGAVSWRKADGITDWSKVNDFKQEIEPSWPVIVRISDGGPRTVARVPKPGEKDFKPGHDTFHGTRQVMVPVPVEGQTLDVWDEVWRPSMEQLVAKGRQVLERQKTLGFEERVPSFIACLAEWEYEFEHEFASVPELADGTGREPVG